MRRAKKGEQIYPTTYQRQVDAVLGEKIVQEMEVEPAVDEAARAQELADASAAARSIMEEWETNMEQAAAAGDLDLLTDLAAQMPEGIGELERIPGEDYNFYVSRLWDETKARVQQAADELKIAENLTRSQDAMKAQEQAGEAAMTRALLLEKYAEAFPNVSSNQLHDWMDVSDAALETIGRIIGKSKDEMYAAYQDVLRGASRVT